MARHFLLVTKNEPGGGFLRLVVPGGRTGEPTERGPGGIGAAAIGFRTLQEVGAVGQWTRKQAGTGHRGGTTSYYHATACWA
jgi:hypothetical protein